jgi:hypothetical protein
MSTLPPLTQCTVLIYSTHTAVVVYYVSCRAICRVASGRLGKNRNHAVVATATAVAAAVLAAAAAAQAVLVQHLPAHAAVSAAAGAIAQLAQSRPL